MKEPCVYILASKPYGTLYVGVTSDLYGRMAEHVQGLHDGFTRKWKIDRLVYYEMHETMEAAILREKRLKKWHRPWKYRLIEQMNPEWQNLFDEDKGEIAFGPADEERLHGEPMTEAELARDKYDPMWRMRR
jgi:putative endonuclease